jgi:hypothetical protein
MTIRVLIILAAFALLLLALAGAFVELARGRRPLLLGRQALSAA